MSRAAGIVDRPTSLERLEEAALTVMSCASLSALCWCKRLTTTNEDEVLLRIAETATAEYITIYT
jgi:hypothetical protein